MSKVRPSEPYNPTSPAPRLTIALGIPHSTGPRSCIDKSVSRTRFGRKTPTLFQSCPTHSRSLLSSLQRDWLALFQCQPCDSAFGTPNSSSISPRNASAWCITPALLPTARWPSANAKHRRNRWGTFAAVFPSFYATTHIHGRTDRELAILW